MHTLIAIGYWYSPDEQGLPHPEDWLGTYPDPDSKQKVLNHLKSGQRLHEWKGSSWCRFQCGVPHEEMGRHDLSDGTYIWPEGLAHYVEEHEIRLPDTFIAHILSKRHSVFTPDPYATEVDFDWWISCKSQKT